MRTNICFAILAVFLGSSLVHAQAILGQIIVPSGPHPAERIEVTIEQPGGQVVARTYSNVDGNFGFNSFPACDCNVVVRLDGYKEARVAVGRAPNGSRITIQLLREDAKPAANAGSPIADIEELRRRYPKKILDEYEKATNDLQSGNSRKAVERLQGLLKTAPDFSAGHNSLGSALQKLERFDEAEKEYKMSHELTPRWASPLVNLGGLHVQLGDAANLRKAMDELREALLLDPADAMGYYFLGAVHYNLGSYADAEANLKRALELRKGLTPARLMSVNLYVRQQRWREALEQIDAYLRENSEGAEREQILNIRSKILSNIQ